MRSTRLFSLPCAVALRGVDVGGIVGHGDAEALYLKLEGEAAATLAARPPRSQQPARGSAPAATPQGRRTGGRRSRSAAAASVLRRLNRRRTAARAAARPARSAASSEDARVGLRRPDLAGDHDVLQAGERRAHGEGAVAVRADMLVRPSMGTPRACHRLDRRLGLGDRAGEHLPPARLPGDDGGLVLGIARRPAARGCRRTRRRRRGACARPWCRRWPGTSRARPDRGRSWNRACADPSAR